MKIIHIVPHINEEASGPSYSVPRLCSTLASLGNDVEISCLATKADIPNVRLNVHPQWPVLRSFAVSPSHAISLWNKSFHVDVVHNHSLWSMVNVSSGLIVPGKHAKLVTSPRGTLAPWALSRNKCLKRILWPLQRRVLEKADLLHATSEVEYGEIRTNGFLAPVAVIPNGIDLPILPTVQPSVEGRILLFLSRLHPTKCVDRLLHAWSHLQTRHPTWRLVIAGKGEEGYEQELRELAKRLALRRVTFPGPIYGDAKSRAYFEADLFALPTHSENFGMVVAEALAHECPVVVSQGAPWAGLETEGCGWWTKHDLQSLTDTLDTAMSLPPDILKTMGKKGRSWMERDFGWEAIGSKMEAAYHWILEGGERPEFIKVD